MRRLVITALILSIVLLGSYADAMGQSAFAEGPRPRADKEKIRERIETMKMWKLTKELNLDEKTASRLFPLLNEYDKRRSDIERNIRTDVASLRNSLHLQNGMRIQKLLNSLEKKHDMLMKLDHEERSRLKDILTLEQQARYLLFTMEFKKEIRKLITEARLKRDKKAAKQEQAGP